MIHNGVAPYPGVIDALRRLKAAGRPVTLLSNAPARARNVIDRIVSIGVPRDLFGDAVSSGEEVWLNLRDRTDPFYAALGRRCLHLGTSWYGGLLAGLDLEAVERPDQADFILNAGPDLADEAASALLPLLRDAVARGLPMICANPDLVVVHGTTRIVCAGQVAKIYEGLGGTVRWHGKPYKSVYRRCLALPGFADTARVLAVGDSLRTDIGGAAAAGLDSLLIAGGIHAAEFGWRPGGTLDAAAVLERLGEARPTYVAPGFGW